MRAVSGADLLSSGMVENSFITTRPARSSTGQEGISEQAAGGQEPSDTNQEQVQAAGSEETREQEEARLRREANLAYLALWLETKGAPEEKLDQQEAAEAVENEDEDDEEELKRMRRGTKNATVMSDPENPSQVNITVYSYDKEGNPKVTRKMTVDTGQDQQSTAAVKAQQGNQPVSGYVDGSDSGTGEMSPLERGQMLAGGLMV